MSTPKATLSFKKLISFSKDGATDAALILGLVTDKDNARPAPTLKVPKELQAAFGAAVAHPPFKGTWASTSVFLGYPAGIDGLPYAHLIMAGVGTTADAHAQNALALGARLALDLRAAQLEVADLYVDSFFHFPGAENSPSPRDYAGRPLKGGVLDAEALIEKLGIGLLLGLYSFEAYKSKKKPERPLKIRFVSQVFDEKAGQEILRKATLMAESVYVARDLMNTPANDLRPADLATQAVALGRRAGFKTTVWDEKKIQAHGMNGLLFVGRGSEAPPRFIIMEHNASRKDLPTLVLVGKGVTFDTGGISIKPSAGMDAMKMDMGGAANVIAALYGIALSKAPVRVIGLVASAENMPSATAGRPGDVYTALGGKTVEVLNTDAEGRLVLADALVHAKTFKPDAVVDVATLTGAVMLALGGAATGIMGNNGALIEGFTRASSREGERVWELPLFEAYAEDLKGKVADLQNIGNTRTAGAQKGGAFLNAFVEEAYPWLHVDIAGVMDASKEQGPHCSGGGGTGIPTRSLIEFATGFTEYFQTTKHSAKNAKASSSKVTKKRT